MKILHTSDWHLGRAENSLGLYDDQRAFVDEIIDIASRENVDAVIIAGDVYDRSVAQGEAIKLYSYAMTKLCLTLHKKVIVIAGNHDSSERLADCNRILAESGLYIESELERKPHIVSMGNTDFYLFPYFAIDRVRSLYPEKKDEIKTLTDACRVVCDEARGTFDPAKRHIAIAHAFVTGAVTSKSDRMAEIAAVGTASQIDVNVFHDFDYVALGHIHGPQNIGENARYSGTPMAYSFGREEHQEKSVTIIDTSDMKREVILLHPLHSRTTIEGTFDEVMDTEYSEEIRTGFTCIKITDKYIGIENAASIKEKFPLALSILGKEFESDSGTIKMSIEEFEELQHDPTAIFKSFCMDVLDTDPSEHILGLFNECVHECEEGDTL